MEKTRPNVQVSKPKCPYCHDEIVGGGRNHACHECLTWHHHDCFLEHKGCVTCGNDWMPSGYGNGYYCLNPLFEPTLEDVRVLAGVKGTSQDCQHDFNSELLCIHCHQDAEVVFGEAYADALLDAREKAAFDNELIVCWAEGCEEAARRADQFCSLCTSEIEIFGEPKGRPDLSKAERREAISNMLREKERDSRIGGLCGVLLFVSCIAVIVFAVVRSA